MKRLLMALSLILMLNSASLWAQDVPKIEVFGGGSALNINDNNFKLTSFGWTASVAGSVSKLMGIVGEVAGDYKNGSNFHSFLGGGQFTHRGSEQLSVFAQGKAGLLRSSGPGGVNNDFQLGIGGGIDWKATPKISFRLFQLDWLPTRAPTNGNGHEWVSKIARLSIGVIFKSETN